MTARTAVRRTPPRYVPSSPSDSPLGESSAQPRKTAVAGNGASQSLRVPFYRHHLGAAEKQSLLAALDQTFLTTGTLTVEFERRFADLLGVRRAVGMSSWTDAARLALLAWGIGPGDEVITTPLTFIASANVILHVGATPVLVDVDSKTYLIDPDAVRQAVTPRSRAILPVHLYGLMCDMCALREIADRHGLRILEDAAHCVEGRRDGTGPGGLGDAAAFSFYATKNLTCGEGGAVATRDESLADRLAVLRLHGMDKSAANRHGGRYAHWDMTELGWKANLSNLDAALLLPQLPGVESRLQRREAICRRYEAAIAELDGLSVQEIPAGARSARHLFTILTPPGRRDVYLAELQGEGIGVAVNYRAITELTWYQRNRGLWRAADSLARAEEIGWRTLTLPLYPTMNDDEVVCVIDALRRVHGRLA